MSYKLILNPKKETPTFPSGATPGTVWTEGNNLYVVVRVIGGYTLSVIGGTQCGDGIPFATYAGVVEREFTDIAKRCKWTYKGRVTSITVEQ